MLKLNIIKAVAAVSLFACGSWIATPPAIAADALQPHTPQVLTPLKPLVAATPAAPDAAAPAAAAPAKPHNAIAWGFATLPVTANAAVERAAKDMAEAALNFWKALTPELQAKCSFPFDTSGAVQLAFHSARAKRDHLERHDAGPAGPGPRLSRQRPVESRLSAGRNDHEPRPDPQGH